MSPELPEHLDITSSKEEQTGTHGFHPYFASFNPQIPRKAMKWFTSEGDIVLDPFCGSGTTLVEAKLGNRNSIGIDVNPLACLITKVKTTAIRDKKLLECFNLLNRIKMNINAVHGQLTLSEDETLFLQPGIPEFRNRDYWFKPHVLEELGIIKAHILSLENEDLKDFCSVAFSSIVVKVSNQQHETRYKRVDKSIKPYETYEIFKSKLVQMIKEMKTFNRAAYPSKCDVYCEDLRHSVAIEDDEVDLIVTSPPYLNAWDYNLYQRFRFFWLDFDHRKFRDLEIGAHLKHSYIDNSIKKYADDMSLCLKQMFRMLKKSAVCCIVIGEAFVQGRRVDVPQILIDEAVDLGFDLEKIYTKEVLGPHFSQGRSAENKSESIIFLRKA